MPTEYITHYFSNEGDRHTIRMNVVNLFAQEAPGSGRGNEASRYIYYVEHLSTGQRVYLQRPAFLYNGFDFCVCVEGVNFAPAGKRRRNYPTHGEIIDDLYAKRHADPHQYASLYHSIQSVYDCHEINDVQLATLNFPIGYNCDLIVKTLKWLFIEQDIRYWNYSGRDMLWSSIPIP